MKKILDVLFKSSHSVADDSNNLTFALNKMIKTIEDNYVDAFCISPIKTERERYLLFLETVLYYRVLAQLLAAGVMLKQTDKNMQKYLMTFSYNIDDTIAKLLQGFSSYFDVNDYMKYYEIRCSSYGKYLLELTGQSVLPDFSPDMFNRLNCLLSVFNAMHCYMIQKTGAMVEDDYVFKNSQQILSEVKMENIASNSGKMLAMFKSMKDMVVCFAQEYNKL